MRTRLRLRPERATKCPSFKCGYATRDEALRAAEMAMLNGLVDPGCHITPYLCERCGEYHNANRRIVPAHGRV